MTYDEATTRLVALARLNGDTVTAAQMEGDPGALWENREIVCAAARTLGGGTKFPRTGKTRTAASGSRSRG